MKRKIIIAVFAAVSVLLAICAALLYNNREKKTETAVLYGVEYLLDTEKISLEGNEFSNVEDLINDLKPFASLKVLDLGEHELHVYDLDVLTNSLPGVEVICRSYVNIYGEKVFTDTVTLDLSGKDVSDVSELRAGIPYLPSLTEVVSSTSEIPIEQYEKLKSEFTGIKFDMVCVVDVCGQKVRGDAESLDLRKAQIDSELGDKLALLTSLKTVDLHGVDISLEEKHALADRFPDVSFGWEVEIAGKTYDSFTEDIDFSRNRKITVELMRECLPLMRGVKRIDLSDCGNSNEDLGALREEFPNVKIVWRITMGQWSLKTDAIAFSVLIYNYEHTRLRTKDIEVLKYCTDLQALDLGHQSISDISVIGDYLPELRILILADNIVNDLTPLSKLKHLHYLELFVNYPLNDLSPLAECKELVDLNISYLYSIRDITPILDLPLLERLWLEHTNIAASDIQLLRDTYPDATVISQGEGSIDQGWRTHPRYFAMIDMFHKKDYISEEFSKYDGLAS